MNEVTRLFEQQFAQEQAQWWAQEAEWLRTPGTIEYAQRRRDMIRQFQNKAAQFAALAKEG